MKIKYQLLFFFAINIAILACYNQPDTKANTTNAVVSGKKKNIGKLEFTKEIHNFGTLKEGEIVAYSFQFKNNGTAPFRLTKVEPTCGCLSIQYNKDEIAIQGLSVIDVIFHSEGEWGNQLKSVMIETSDGEKKTLTIGAYVENENFNFDLNNLK